jgi:protein TonB
MNRTGVSFFLSTAFHIALLSAFAIIPVNERSAVHNADIRITLVARERRGPTESTNSSGPAAAPAEHTLEQHQAPQPAPDIAEPPTPPSEPDVKIDPTPPPVAEKQESVEPPKHEIPVKEAPKKPVEPPKTTTPPKRETTPKPTAKPSETKPAQTANSTAPKPQATQNAPPPSVAAIQPGAAAGNPNSSPSTNPSGAEKNVSESPVSAPKILDAASLKITKKVNPDYPMISRKRRDQGTVVLLIEITSGQVVAVELEKSSGHSPLDEAAIRAIRDWRFDMSGYGDHVTARIPFKFDLK